MPGHLARVTAFWRVHHLDATLLCRVPDFLKTRRVASVAMFAPNEELTSCLIAAVRWTFFEAVIVPYRQMHLAKARNSVARTFIPEASML